MAEEANVPSTENTVETQERTFTQAEVNALIQSRLDRERKKYPSDDELTAYNTWKNSQKTEQTAQAALAESQAALAAAQSEVEQLKRDKYVLSKGLTGDEAEFIAFKAAKLVTEQTTFEQAVDSLTSEKAKTTFDWTAPVGDSGQGTSTSSIMNALIRGKLT